MGLTVLLAFSLALVPLGFGFSDRQQCVQILQAPVFQSYDEQPKCPKPSTNFAYWGQFWHDCFLGRTEPQDRDQVFPLNL